MAQISDISRDVSIYYSSMSSKKERKTAQNNIDKYMDQCYSNWYELFVQINEIKINPNLDQLSMNHCLFPFLALNHIVKERFDKIVDIDNFYKELYDVYINNFKKIAENQNCELSSILFNKFVELFVSLALKDNSNTRYELTLTGFKSIIDNEEDFQTRLMHVRFVAKYIKYLYEDFHINFKGFDSMNESTFKNNYCKDFIERIKDNLYQVQDIKAKGNSEDIPVDDILIGLSFAYAWISELISSNDFALLSDVHLYEDIDKCLICFSNVYKSKIIETSDVARFIDIIDNLFNCIGKDNKKTLKLAGCILFKIIYESEDVNIATIVLSLAIDTIKKFATNYELCTQLFCCIECFMQKYAKGSNIDPEKSKSMLEEVTGLVLEVSKFPKLENPKYGESKISSTYLALSNSVENKTDHPFEDKIQDILCVQTSRLHTFEYMDQHDNSKEDEYDEKSQQSDDEEEKEDHKINQIPEFSDQMKEFIEMRYSSNCCIFAASFYSGEIEHVISYVLNKAYTLLENQNSNFEHQLDIESTISVLNCITPILLETPQQSHSTDQAIDSLLEFYCKDSSKYFLFGEDVAHFVTRKSLSNLIKLYKVEQNDSTKSSLILLLIEIFTQPHILLSRECSTLDFYADIFVLFCKAFGKDLESGELKTFIDIISAEIIPVLVRREDLSYDSAYTYFNALGNILQHTGEEIRDMNTKNCFEYIANMVSFAQNVDQFELCTYSIVNFMYSVPNKYACEPKILEPNEVPTSLDIQIFDLFSSFVARIAPKITLDNCMEPKKWELDSFTPSETKLMLELRKSIMRLISCFFGKVGTKTLADIYKISYPVIMSFIFPPEDCLTHKPARIEDLISLCRTISLIGNFYDKEVLELTTMVFLRLLNLVKEQLSKVHEQTYDEGSFAYHEVRTLVNHYLNLVMKVSQLDVSRLLNGNVGPVFFEELVNLCINLIDNFEKYSDCAIHAMNLLLWLLKELTSDEDKAVQSINPSFGSSNNKYNFTDIKDLEKINMLKAECFDLAKDLIFDSYKSKYSPNDKRNEVREITTSMICELAKIDENTLKILKKYWREERNIDQCIAFRVKEAIEYMIQNEGSQNQHAVKMQCKKKMTEALEKHEVFAYSKDYE